MVSSESELSSLLPGDFMHNAGQNIVDLNMHYRKYVKQTAAEHEFCHSQIIGGVSVVCLVLTARFWYQLMASKVSSSIVLTKKTNAGFKTIKIWLWIADMAKITMI